MTLWIFVIAFGLRNMLEPFVAYGRPHGTERPHLGTGLGTLVGMIAAFALSGVAVAVWLYLDAAPATPRFWIAMALLAASYLGRVAAMRQLGSAYSQNLNAPDSAELVTSGVFAVVRHPIYAFFILETWALWLVRPNLVSASAWGVILVIVVYRLRREEAALEGRYRQRYADYRRSTKALVPFVF